MRLPEHGYVRRKRGKVWRVCLGGPINKPHKFLSEGPWNRFCPKHAPNLYGQPQIPTRPALLNGAPLSLPREAVEHLLDRLILEDSQ